MPYNMIYMALHPLLSKRTPSCFCHHVCVIHLLLVVYANSLLATYVHATIYQRILPQSHYLTLSLNFRSIHRDEVSRDLDGGNDAIRFSMPGARSRSTTVCSCGGGSGKMELSPIKTKVDTGRNDKGGEVSGPKCAAHTQVLTCGRGRARGFCRYRAHKYHSSCCAK